jgi:hypothetical protein
LLLWLSCKLEVSVTDENNEMLQAMWKHMGELVHGLEQRLTARFDAKIDGLEIKLDVFQKQTQDNFARVQRNFDRVGLRLDDIEMRLTRVEEFCGLHPMQS